METQGQNLNQRGGHHGNAGRHDGGGGKELLPNLSEAEPSEFIDKIDSGVKEKLRSIR